MVDKINPFVFLDVKFGGNKAQRIILELFKDTCPLTVENFRALCTGEKGMGKKGKLHYTGCVFHKTVSLVLVQGGDVTHGNGGESIYGPTFNDENFILKNTKGMLGMANCGPNTNSSQFYITVSSCPQLDNKNVVFGQVKAGFRVAQEISREEADPKNCPLQSCTIINCGEILPGEDWGINENDGTQDKFPTYPEDLEISYPNLKCYGNVIDKIKISGNHFFDKGSYNDAAYKYQKALKYIEWMEQNCEPSETSDLQKIKLCCTLNLSAVFLKMDLYRDAFNKSDEVLKIDKKSAKALYRRGQARVRLGEYEPAMKDFMTAQMFAPNDKAIKLEIRSLRKVVKKYTSYEKTTFKRMFKGLNYQVE